MEQIIIYLLLFGVIVVIGQLFQKTSFPIALLLVLAGMLLSLIPAFPAVPLNSDVVLDIFLPVLVYQISAFASWPDTKKNIRPIALLSVGHVIFIAILVAVVIHHVIPDLSWSLAFVLGAVVSPPDDVAIVAIADKIRIPRRIVTILEGEGMFNDAMALILFRFALAAVITNQFSPVHAVASFFAVLVGETLYGLLVGYVIGELRTKIQNTSLHVIASLLTPFIAYIPAIMLGGSGVLATVVTGFVIGNRYALRFSPEFRLVSRAIWPSLAFTLQSILFLLVGLDLRVIIERISTISFASLALYGITIVGLMIVGRFVWVYASLIYLPRVFSTRIRNKDPYPPWQYPFIVSWAGMRGGISLAAALAIPALPTTISGANSRDLIVFLVFCAIAATLLLQGLSLPWLLKKIGVRKFSRREKYNEHVDELNARLVMIKAALKWLIKYKKEIKVKSKLLDEVTLLISEYELRRDQLKDRILDHDSIPEKHNAKSEAKEEACLLNQLVAIERSTLLQLWREEKINLEVRNRLLDRLDHRAKYLPA